MMRSVILLFMVLSLSLSFAGLSPAVEKDADQPFSITADSLEHFKAEDKYIAAGNVRIKHGDTDITADHAVYSGVTSVADLKGHVVISNPESLINAEDAIMNLDDKTGSLNKAVIFFRKDNYWISGPRLQKIGESHYFAKEAYFTTCDTEDFQRGKGIDPSTLSAQQPDWCFRAEDADLVVGEGLTSKKTTYRVKGVPVLYTPRFWGPVTAERHTGFLMPRIGSSSRKGFEFSPQFFWAIDENRDATFGLDYHSKSGLGASAEYRYVEPGQKGSWYAWFIHDNELKKDFLEALVSDKREYGNLKTMVDVRYVNHNDLYKEYKHDFESDPTMKMSIQRFLQSSAEGSYAFGGGRAYLLGQYWVNLRDEDKSHILQRLPEAGFVINPVPLGGSMILSLAANAANFTRESDVHGRRFDIMPQVTHSMGDAFRFTQTLALRETAYQLSDSDLHDSSLHRESLNYKAQIQTRLTRDYGSFLHILEPSLEYSYIPRTKDVPLFDSTDLFDRTSVVQASVFNRLLFTDATLSLRLAQPYDLNAGGRAALLPLRLDGALTGNFPVRIRFDLAYDIDEGRLETAGSNIGFTLWKDSVLSFGQRYIRQDDVMLLTMALDMLLDKHWLARANIGYDAKGAGLRNSAVSLVYQQQCWNLGTTFSRKPGDGVRSAEYVFMLFLELKGIGAFKVL